MKPNWKQIARCAHLWYPIMLAQERGEMTESKGAELLGLNIEEYREAKQTAIDAVTQLINTLPSPLWSLVDVLRHQPDWFD